MHAQYHEELTRTALAGCFSTEALNEIVRANLGQDSLLNLLRSKYHFDANAFEESHVYTQEQVDLVVAYLEHHQPGPARKAFGRLTHAVQDYYAHTNYAALWQERNPARSTGVDNLVDPLDPVIMESGRLVAARVYYPLEALTIFPALVPALQRRLPADSHANMNLDSPARGPLFPIAMAAARRRTEIAFAEISEKIVSGLGINAVNVFTGL